MSRDLALFVLRLSGLGLALFHGWGKVLMLASGQGQRFVEGVANLGFPLPWLFAWSAALAEFLGGLLVFVGLKARVAAVFCGFTMLVAAFGRHKAHLHLAAKLGLYPAGADELKDWGNPELALVYLICFVAVGLLGPGRWAPESLGRKR